MTQRACGTGDLLKGPEPGVFTAVYAEMGAKPLPAAAAEGLATTILRAVVIVPTHLSQAWPLRMPVCHGASAPLSRACVCLPATLVCALRAETHSRLRIHLNRDRRPRGLRVSRPTPSPPAAASTSLTTYCHSACAPSAAAHPFCVPSIRACCVAQTFTVSLQPRASPAAAQAI